MKNNRRLTLWNWFVFEVLKSPQGKIMPWYLLILRAVMFPLDTIKWKLKTTGNHYDPFMDIWYINGIKYSGKIFFHLAKGSPDIYFQIENRKNGFVTLKKYNKKNESTKSSKNENVKI